MMNTTLTSYNLQVKHLIRGKGKIFCSLELTSHASFHKVLPQDVLPKDFSCMVHVHTNTQAYGDLPCELIDDTRLEQLVCPKPDGVLRSWVCVLAILDIPQILDICVYKKDELVLTKRVTISARYASYMGKYHSFTHDVSAWRIRNIDAKGNTKGPRIDLLAVNAKGSLEELNLYVRTPRLADDMQRLDMRIYAQDGTLLSKDVQVLSESFSPASGISQYGEQVSIVSAEIPQQTRGICVWARLIKENGDASLDMCIGVDTPSSHVVFEDFYLADIRSQSARYIAHAAEDLTYTGWISQHSAPYADRYIQQASYATQKQSAKTAIRLALVIYTQGHTSSEIRATYLSCMRQTIDVEVVCVCTAMQADALRLELNKLYCDEDMRARIHVVSDDEIQKGIAHSLQAHCGTCTHIGCLEAGDILEDDCIYWYMIALIEHPDVALVYADEDTVSRDACGMVASAHHPYFKPDFDIHLLRSFDYTAHMLVARLEFVEAGRKSSPELFDVSSIQWCATYALICAHLGKHAHHIPRVLYHASSVHKALEARKAPSESLKHNENEVHRSTSYAMLVDAVFGCDTTNFSRHFVYAKTHKIEECITWKYEPLVSIIIPTKDNIDVLLRCVRSIYEKSTWRNFEVIVVENNSEEARTFEVYEELTRAYTNLSVMVCEMGGVFNFSRVVNAGAKSSHGDYLLFLNNDTEVITPDWIERLTASAQEHTTGIVGAKLLFPNNTIQHAGVVLGANLWSPQHLYTGYPADNAGYAQVNASIHEMHAVTGACIMMKKEVFTTLGGFDETLPVNFNDTDLCLKARAHGLVCVQRNDCVLYHHESVSRGHADDTTRLNRLMFDFGVFWTRWKDVLSYPDPYYSKNFGFNNIYCGLDAHR